MGLPRLRLLYLFVGLSAIVAVLAGLAYLLAPRGAPASGTVVISLASAKGDRLSGSTLQIGSETLALSGEAPAAPAINSVRTLSLASGTYRMRLDGTSLDSTITVTADQVQPVLLAVASGRVLPGGVYVGSESLNLGRDELGGKLIPAPDFQLVDQDGRTVTRDSLLGRDTVIAAFHTNCRQTCPLYTGLLFQLRKSAPQARLLEVTTDPVTDSPAALAAYRSRIDADWSFATGSVEQITEFWAPFGIQPSTGDTHTSALVLVDDHGYIRIAYTGVPDVGGKLPGALDQQLDDAGRKLLDGHGEGWGAPQVLDSLKSLVVSTSQPAGGPAPPFSLPSLDGGNKVSLEEFRGRPVILNFWWSGCPPCRAEMPMLQRFSEQHPGAALLLVDSSDSSDVARTFVNSLGLHATVLLDPDGSTAAAYHVAALPTTVVVGPDGAVRYQHPGQVPEDALSAQIANLGA